jgi:hypothetical protein
MILTKEAIMTKSSLRLLLGLIMVVPVIGLAPDTRQPVPRCLTVPAKWVNKIKEHLEKIEKNQWGMVFPGELYRGHLILKKNHSPIRSIDQLFQNTALILYHSDEGIKLWLEESELPIEKRTPRSIVGYWDGRVLAAASLMKEPVTSFYWTVGTIRSDDLADELHDQLALHRDQYIRLPSGEVCPVDLVVDISITYNPQIKANLHLGDRNYTVTMDCIVR